MLEFDYGVLVSVHTRESGLAVAIKFDALRNTPTWLTNAPYRENSRVFQELKSKLNEKSYAIDLNLVCLPKFHLKVLKNVDPEAMSANTS